MSQDDQNDTPAWEASKENIQPLRRGRNIVSLTEALTLDPEIIETRKRKFEEELRTYDGNDPLEIWDRYFTWLEEHYPSGTFGAHLPQLLENCILAFISEAHQRYQNDPRYVRIWLKFASLHFEPEEVYKCMVARGVGVGSALLYMEWAEYHDLSGCPRRALEILENGHRMLAQPVDTIRTALRQLLLRSVQDSDSRDYQEDQETRSALSQLRVLSADSFDAPVLRVGDSRLELRPGTIPQVTCCQDKIKSTLPSKKPYNKFKVFADKCPGTPVEPSSFECNGMRTIVGSMASSASRAHHLSSHKENTQKAVQRFKKKCYQRIPVYGGPSFTVVEDDISGRSIASGDTSISTRSHIMGMARGTLSARRKVDDSQMTLLSQLAGGDMPSINEKRMYDFVAIYAGTSEYQFEEIRLARMRRRQRELACEGTKDSTENLDDSDGTAAVSVKLEQ